MYKDKFIYMHKYRYAYICIYNNQITRVHETRESNVAWERLERGGKKEKGKWCNFILMKT